ADPFQVARISFLEFQSVETRLRSPLVPGVDEVLRNVDSHDFGPETGERERRGAISAAYIEDPNRRRNPERLYEYLSGFTHECGDLGEVALFPQRFVRIHHCSLRRYGSKARRHSRRPASATTGLPEKAQGRESHRNPRIARRLPPSMVPRTHHGRSPRPFVSGAGS